MMTPIPFYMDGITKPMTTCFHDFSADLALLIECYNLYSMREKAQTEMQILDRTQSPGPILKGFSQTSVTWSYPERVPPNFSHLVLS